MRGVVYCRWRGMVDESRARGGSVEVSEIGESVEFF